MFSFKRNPPSSPTNTKRPTLLPPRPSYAHSPDSRSGSPTSSRRESFGFGGPRSPSASPALSHRNGNGNGNGTGSANGDGYFNLPLSSPRFPNLDDQARREWSEESLSSLRSSVISDIKKADEILRLLKIQKETVLQLAGLHKDLSTSLKKLGTSERLGSAIRTPPLLFHVLCPHRANKITPTLPPRGG